eukprot:scaffold45214_cov36-Phaeocystis_antarctica.AAC.2
MPWWHACFASGRIDGPHTGMRPMFGFGPREHPGGHIVARATSALAIGSSAACLSQSPKSGVEDFAQSGINS